MKVLFMPTIAVCLFTSVYCYTRIFFRLRHQDNQVSNLREVENQQPRADIRRYRKTVFSALWLQFAMLFFFLFCRFCCWCHSRSEKLKIILHQTECSLPIRNRNNLNVFNSTLKTIFYCWRIKEVRRAVKNILLCLRE